MNTAHRLLKLTFGLVVLIMLFESNFKEGEKNRIVASPKSPTQSEAYTTPFKGRPLAIPGKIEAEHFDKGNEGVAYHDIDPENIGKENRPHAPNRNTGVDIEVQSVASGGQRLGWVRAGEWVLYTVDVLSPGTYTIEARVASKGEGGTFHIEFGGEDKTGPIRVPSTGDWIIQETVTKRGVKLSAGRQVMKIVMDSEWETGSVGDIDYLRFVLEEDKIIGSANKLRSSSKDKPKPIPFTGEPFLIPGLIEAEHFDIGGEGVAYHDLEPENVLTKGDPEARYRDTGVEVLVSEKASGGYALSEVYAGEWLQYTVEVQTAGTYTIEVGASSYGGQGTFHIEFGGEDKTGLLKLRDTWASDRWASIKNTGVNLSKGQQLMRLVMDSNGESGTVGNIDFIRFSKSPSEPEPPEARTNTVEVRVIDTESGKTTPCMVCITNFDDGRVRLPPDGRVHTKLSSLGDFEKGIPFNPDDRNWIGPVRTTVWSGVQEERSLTFRYVPSLPYWKEPVMYQTTGNFSIKLPDGRWRIALSHGMEYVPVVEEFETRGGNPITKRIEMKRWIDLAKKGWYSGDVHVHHPTATELDRQYMLEYAVAEDLHVSNMLEWSHHYPKDADQENITTQYKVNGFGEKFRVNRGEYWLISGQEDSNVFGCIEALNIGQIVPYTIETDGFLDRFYEGWHSKKEAVVGWPHFASWSRRSPGFAWSVTTGHIEFVELLQFRMYTTEEYHEYLNLGFKLTAAAGSDFAWGSTLGEVRTYVYTGTPLDIDLWFANLKKGHTFVSNGPVLEFTVDGQLPGSELAKEPGSTAKVMAKVLGHPKVGLPSVLTIAGNDGIIKQITNEEKNSELSIELELSIEKSQWFVAHSECTNGAVAHTSPVYVIVAGKSFWNLERGPDLIEERIKLVREVEKEFAQRTDSRSKGMVQRMRKAIQFYTDLKEKMDKRLEKDR